MVAMVWSVRSATEGDAEQVAALNGLVQALHHATRPDRFKEVDPAGFLPVAKSWFESPAIRLWVAEREGGSLVGYVKAIRHVRPDHPLTPAATFVELDQIVVDPVARREGVGSLLAERVFAWADEVGADRVELSTWAFNRDAQAMFTRLGFSTDFSRLSRDM